LNKQRTANIGLAIWRLKCFYETFVQGSTAVILLNICAKNPPHRQAENRYKQPYDVQTMNDSAKMNDTMPTLRKIKRGASLPTSQRFCTTFNFAQPHPDNETLIFINN
jgi:hypothetical protein